MVQFKCMRVKQKAYRVKSKWLSELVTLQSVTLDFDVSISLALKNNPISAERTVY